jgi:hypothetical protein
MLSSLHSIAADTKASATFYVGDKKFSIQDGTLRPADTKQAPTLIFNSKTQQYDAAHIAPIYTLVQVTD